MYEFIESYPSLRSRDKYFGKCIGIDWFDNVYNFLFYGEKNTFTLRTATVIEDLKNDIMKSLEEYEEKNSNTKNVLPMDKDMESYELIESNGYCFMVLMIRILQRKEKLRDKKLVVYDLLESINDFDFRMLQEEKCIRCTTFKQFMKKYGFTVYVYENTPESENSNDDCDNDTQKLAIYVGVEGCKLIFNNKHKGIDLNDDDKIHNITCHNPNNQT